MKLRKEEFEGWLRSQEAALPGVTRLFDEAVSPTMILGASALALYADQGWIPPLRRRTGDLDLSVSLPHGESDYRRLKEVLIETGYRIDPRHPYRFHPPRKIPGALAYIDLLAQPVSPEDADRRRAIAAMGAGEEFAFEGFDFALKTGIPVRGKVVLPNPIGLIVLKKRSYRADPILRIKDLGDILELCAGMVSNGSHYEMPGLRDEVLAAPETKEVRAFVEALASGEDPTWDIEDARQELLKRGFSATQIDDHLGMLLQEWIEVLDE